MLQIDGPTAPWAVGEPIYQVTLASGAIATRPSAFPAERSDESLPRIIVTEDGRILGVANPTE